MADNRSCLREHKGNCEGEIGVRYSDLGTAIYECAKHQQETLDYLDGVRRRYPDTSNPPSWFDEADAGERWDDDY
jgi:hypothetical protein